MQRLTQITLIGVLLLAGISLAAAQEAPVVVGRVGNFIEVAPDVFMHIIATGDYRYRTGEQWDFEKRVQDRVQSRATDSTAVMGQECDCMHFQAHFGVDMRYRKELTFHLRFRHWHIYDANIADNRENAENPGGTDKFGRAPENEGEGMNLQQAQINYTFPWAPVQLRLGWQLWFLDQAGILSDNAPRAGVWFNSDPWEAHASAVIQREATRLGLSNDNDFIYYTFGAAYNLKPHRLQFDVVYFRDRFHGAPLGTTVGVDPSPPSTSGSRGGLPGFQGQKHDVVMIMPSWSGTLGPVAALVQGYILVGTAETTTLRTVAGNNRDLDVFAGAAIAYAEARLGLVSPYVGLVYGSGDGDPTDRKLHGFNHLGPLRNSSAWTGTARFAHLDRVHGLAGRDTKTPAGANRPNPNGLFGGDEFGHTVGDPFMDRLGNREHPGINTTFSNPGVIAPFVGLKVFPLKGHELAGTYVYRRMVDDTLLTTRLRTAGLLRADQSISRALYHSLNGYWMWTLIRHFDMRLAGGVVIPAAGSKDVARTSRAFPCTAANPCQGDDPALWAEFRVRARF